MRIVRKNNNNNDFNNHNNTFHYLQTFTQLRYTYGTHITLKIRIYTYSRSVINYLTLK